MEPSRTTCQPDQNREWDWLTALFPVLVMALIYYRWPVLLSAVSAVGGYLAAAWLWQRAGVLVCRVTSALLTGVVIAFCLPSTAPIWVGAVAGAVAACAAALPMLLSRFLPFDCPRLVPPLTGFLVVRWLFAGVLADYTMPVQWMADTVSSATPLATLGEPMVGDTLTRLFLGVHSAAMGEGCVPVLLLAAGYLLLRRRLRLIAPGAMLLTVALLSWWVFGAPVASLLVGGVMLSALLLADRDVAPAGYGQQAVAGVLAGGLVVLLRATAGVDGSAIAVVVTGLLCPVYGWIFRCFSGKKTLPEPQQAENFAKTEK